MKNFIRVLVLIQMVSLSTSCSSVKVLNSWKSDSFEDVTTNKTLVIVRTANDRNRTDFENEITKHLVGNGFNATESYKRFPKIDPKNELTEERMQEIRKTIEDAGFNAVVLTVLKDVEEVTQVTFEGGYEAGESLTSYYNINNFGFYGYYLNPVSYPSYKGVDVKQTNTVKTNMIYIVETTVYNLNFTGKDQLVAVVTSEIAEPESIYGHADNYAKAIIKGLNKNK